MPSWAGNRRGWLIWHGDIPKPSKNHSSSDDGSPIWRGLEGNSLRFHSWTLVSSNQWAYNYDWSSSTGLMRGCILETHFPRTNSFTQYIHDIDFEDGQLLITDKLNEQLRCFVRASSNLCHEALMFPFFASFSRCISLSPGFNRFNLSEARHLLPASFLPRPHGHMPTGLAGNHKKLTSDIHSNKWDVCQEVNSCCFRYGFNPWHLPWNRVEVTWHNPETTFRFQSFLCTWMS